MQATTPSGNPIVRVLRFFIVPAFFLFGFSSCEKVIDLELDKVEKKYVIEAVLTDQPGKSKVLISQTKDFTENNNFPGVPGAIVTITEQGGLTTTLSQTSAGVYETPALAGISGKTYTLSVTIGTEHFTAKSTMPQRINLDTIFITDEALFTEVNKITNAEFQDPAGRGNSYRFIQYLNNKKTDQVFIMNDEYTDARKITSTLYYFTDEDNEKIKKGDEVRIEMQCIDPAIYKYWFSLLRSATGESGQATPANPVSNIQGGALGYFSAHTFQEKKLIVP